MKLLIVAFAFSALAASAQTNRIAFTNSQGEFIRAEVVRVELARIVYKTEDLNIGAVYFTNLPPDLQKKFHYDPKAIEAKAKADQKMREAKRKADFEKTLAEWEAALPKEMPPKDDVDITEGTYKLIEQNQYHWTWSYKVTFRNNTSDSYEKFLRLKFVDADGFELDHTLVEAHLAAFEKKTVTGTTIIKSSQAPLVANIYRSWDN